MSAAAHSAQPAAIAIGNFDGVHVGHAALIHAAREAVGSQGRVLALVFNPHPLAVLKPAAVPSRLSAFNQRERWLNECGADEVVQLEPTREFLQQSPQAFIEWCVERWRPRAIVEGADFRFGAGRAGSIDTLRAGESTHGYRTIVVDPVEVALSDQSLVRASSSVARWLIERGRVRDAATVLGREYELEARVVRGDQRGRDIGFPTANLEATEQLLPADGIYAGTALRDDGREQIAAISVGTKPTFGELPRTCEAHLLDYDGPVDDYAWTIRLRFAHWQRDQLKYDSVAALVAQLHRDIAATRARFNQCPGTPVPGIARREALRR